MNLVINHPRSTGRVGMTTDEATSLYTFEAFGAPYVTVTRNSDGVRGTLQFEGGGGTPRVYFDFQPFDGKPTIGKVR